MGLPDQVAAAHHDGPLAGDRDPVRLRIWMIPEGVQGRGPGRLVTRFPAFSGWSPSTSFSGETASRTRLASTCLGKGICTRMPSISSSAVQLLHHGDEFPGRDGGRWRELLAADAEPSQALILLRT